MLVNPKGYNKRRGVKMQITKQDLRNIGAARFKEKTNKYLLWGLIVIGLLILSMLGIGFIIDRSIGNNIDMPSIYQETNTENRIEIEGVQSNKLVIDGVEYNKIYDGNGNDVAGTITTVGVVLIYAMIICGYFWYSNKMEMAAKEFEHEAENQKLEVVD